MKAAPQKERKGIKGGSKKARSPIVPKSLTKVKLDNRNFEQHHNTKSPQSARFIEFYENCTFTLDTIEIADILNLYNKIQEVKQNED